MLREEHFYVMALKPINAIFPARLSAGFERERTVLLARKKGINQVTWYSRATPTHKCVVSRCKWTDCAFLSMNLSTIRRWIQFNYCALSELCNHIWWFLGNLYCSLFSFLQKNNRRKQINFDHTTTTDKKLFITSIYLIKAYEQKLVFTWIEKESFAAVWCNWNWI